MCQDMRRLERMAEQKKRSKKEENVSFVVDLVEEIRATAKAKNTKRAEQV